ncbi:osmotically inducible protein OsmC [Raineyella antarctica]|uniref:Osmotically inducible protein OsmC n=1 Tax=Raineyella antarctica TaxID=1577474 RepID=A0A1G6GQB4_9ACTN|nr:OsmC family peroxiredoxin [Raineyella antarctica]SDB83406.1 osmotically inducible protein OsmC [Raineyella antarctica]
MGNLTSSTSTTHWDGDLMSGSGTTALTTSGIASFDVSWAKRAEAGADATNPEELLAASYATCFTMALANKLAGNDFPPNSIDTSVTVTFNVGVGIEKIAINVKGDVPGMSDAEFGAAAKWAKENCPIGAALGAVTDKELTVG